MAGVDFDKFGGTKGGFTPVEQLQLKEALKEAAAFSALAAYAAESAFASKRQNVKTWFGNDSPETIKTVVAGVNKMNRFFTDNTRLIRFVDARGQSEKIYSSAQLPAPGAAGRAVHGATVTEKAVPIVVPMGEFDYAYVKCLHDMNPEEPAAAHVGSGMRVFVGERSFNASKTVKDRARVVYHELGHKILGTVDYNAAREIVYGLDDCKALAKTDSASALKHADCWSYFGLSFKYTL